MNVFIKEEIVEAIEREMEIVKKEKVKLPKFDFINLAMHVIAQSSCKSHSVFK